MAAKGLFPIILVAAAVDWILMEAALTILLTDSQPRIFMLVQGVLALGKMDSIVISSPPQDQVMGAMTGLLRLPMAVQEVRPVRLEEMAAAVVVVHKASLV